jgi:hypothetical protein
MATIHGLYADAISNPFADPDGPITSPRFVQRLDAALEEAVQALEYVPQGSAAKP